MWGKPFFRCLLFVACAWLVQVLAADFGAGSPMQHSSVAAADDSSSSSNSEQGPDESGDHDDGSADEVGSLSARDHGLALAAATTRLAPGLARVRAESTEVGREVYRPPRHS